MARRGKAGGWVGTDQRPRRGFGLMEALVAMALTFLLILGTAELVAFSLWAKRKGDIVSGMAQAASSRLETLKSIPFEDAGLEAGTYSETVQDPTSRVTFDESWTVEDVDARQKRVRLDIAARGRTGAAASLVLYISRDLGFDP